MKQEKFYTISELAEAANVTARTIRYYTSEDLLPAPDSRGRYTLYTAVHLQRLQLISRLKENFLPLSEIKARLSQLDDDQVAELLANPHPAVASSESAAEYLSQVLKNQSYTVSYEQHTAEPEEQAMPHVQPSPSAAPLGGAPGAPPAHVPAPPPATSPAEGGLFRKLLPRGRIRSPVPPQPALQAPAPPAETWQRIAIAPGIELHVRPSIDPVQQQRIALLLSQVQTIFDND